MPSEARRLLPIPSHPSPLKQTRLITCKSNNQMHTISTLHDWEKKSSCNIIIDPPKTQTERTKLGPSQPAENSPHPRCQGFWYRLSNSSTKSPIHLPYISLAPLSIHSLLPPPPSPSLPSLGSRVQPNPFNPLLSFINTLTSVRLEISNPPNLRKKPWSTSA